MMLRGCICGGCRQYFGVSKRIAYEFRADNYIEPYLVKLKS